MYKKQRLWLGFLVAAGMLTVTTSVQAQTNQSDVSAGQTFSAPSVSIDSINGNGISNIVQYDPDTGMVYGGGLENEINIGSANVDQGSEITLNEVATVLENNLEQSFNNLAAIENEAGTQVAEGPRRLARRNSDVAGRQTCGCPNLTDEAANARRIARGSDSELCGCDNSASLKFSEYEARRIEAREVVEMQLNESKKFIEELEKIELENNIW
ncbi:hypothetical protein [Pleurocapsa sp. PCC 7319]|uniref:hypothetical protein n=1 Tax=Pleurocapsa sp. PCC 7319 TaxID=118161 RepID=UPI000346B58D|nr:hypothetical protein [Pleurocapsa sp. PCC 7319]